MNAPIQTPDGPRQPRNLVMESSSPPCPAILRAGSVFVGPAPGYQGPVAGPRPANTPIGAIAYTTPEKAADAFSVAADPAAQSLRRGAPAKHQAVVAPKGLKAAAKRQSKPQKSEIETLRKSVGKAGDH